MLTPVGSSIGRRTAALRLRSPPIWEALGPAVVVRWHAVVPARCASVSTHTDKKGRWVGGGGGGMGDGHPQRHRPATKMVAFVYCSSLGTILVWGWVQ